MRIKFPADIAISNALGVELVNLINHKLNKEPIRAYFKQGRD